MDDHSDDLRMIIDSARGFVPDSGDLSAVRAARALPHGFDPAAMAQMAELGWLLMRVDEEHGGLGLGVEALCALMQTLGRGLRNEPIGSSIVACALLQGHVPDDVMAGQAIMVTAWQDKVNSLSWQGGTSDDGLHAQKVHVPGADVAAYVAVVTGAGVALVPRGAPGVSVTPSALQDRSHVGDVHCAAVQADVIDVPDTAARLDTAVLAHAGYLLGVSERAFEITLDYLRIRKQFGQPIGAFQALQHRATDLKTQIELARAAIFATARRIDRGATDAAQHVARCKIRATELSLHMAREAVQMHGAIGIADEADISLFVSKALSAANSFGAAHVHRARLMDALDEGQAA